MTIPLYEDFDNPTGTFANYDTYDSGQRTQLAEQRHVDIRSFIDAADESAYPMFDLDLFSMATLDTEDMLDLESTYSQHSEAWTLGTVGVQTDRNYFNGISLACASGTTTTTSVYSTVDVSSFAAPDYLSLALPAFPLASLTLASTYIDFTSEPSGNFTTGPTDSLPFSASTTTLTAGDCEARFPLSLLATIAPSQITGVRFRITATASCTFRCLSIRCLASTWLYGPIDQNTLYGYLGATVPPTGSITQAYSFPAAAEPVTPTDWPIMMFSDGAGGPSPVDITVGAVITTGSNSATNTFTLYFRELPIVAQDVDDLNSLTMAELELLGHQPDYNPGTLDDFAETNFLTATVQWGTSASIHIKDQTDTGYDFTGVTLAASSAYYVLVTLADDSLRVRLYPADPLGNIDFTTLTFDTTAVIDNNFIRRRLGRFGWYAHFGEGDTSVQTLRPTQVVYGEYRSAPLASVTPVDGARLYTSATPDTQLYPGAVATAGVVIAPDVTKSRSGHCISVRCDGNYPLQGLVTPPVRYENLYETEIEFDVLAPTSTQLLALLQGEQRLALLYLPPFPADRWTHMTLPLTQVAGQIMPGPYALSLVQGGTGQNIWYIDNPSIHARAVSWHGRGQAGDLRHVNDPPWIEFGDAINDPYNAAMLGRGTALQVRGQVLAQGASITGVQILPKYAELGGFAWSDEAPTYSPVPVPSFTFSIPSDQAPTTVAFDGSASTAYAGIMSYYWTFGDGSYGYGETITHTYQLAGTYVANLTVIDRLVLKGSTTQSVTTT